MNEGGGGACFAGEGAKAVLWKVRSLSVLGRMVVVLCAVEEQRLVDIGEDLFVFPCG